MLNSFLKHDAMTTEINYNYSSRLYLFMVNSSFYYMRNFKHLHLLFIILYHVIQNELYFLSTVRLLKSIN